MFDIAWSEFLLIGVVALVVIGPKELPSVIRSVGRAVGKIRNMAGEFRNQFDEAMKESELDELKKGITNLKDEFASTTSLLTNPVSSFEQELRSSIENIEHSGLDNGLNKDKDLLSGSLYDQSVPEELLQKAAIDAQVQLPPPSELSLNISEPSISSVEVEKKA